ncbi:hypothetical protein P2318_25300 [Myxococcaceae bacterium GXIMD 01537]
MTIVSDQSFIIVTVDAPFFVIVNPGVPVVVIVIVAVVFLGVAVDVTFFVAFTVAPSFVVAVAVTVRPTSGVAASAADITPFELEPFTKSTMNARTDKALASGFMSPPVERLS